MNEKTESKLSVLSPAKIKAAQSLIEISQVALTDNMGPILKRVKESGQALVENARVDALGEASDILLEMNNQLEKFNAEAGYLTKKFTSAKRQFNRRLQGLRLIKTVLEEQHIQYERTREGLKNNISKVIEDKDAAQEAAKAMAVEMNRILSEKEQIEVYILTLDFNSDPSEIQNARMALTRREVTFHHIEGVHFLQDRAVDQSLVEIDTREALYGEMAVIGPQLEALISQQQGRMMSHSQVREGINQIQRLREGVRQGAIKSSEMARENAKEAAEIIHSPAIDENTIRAIAKNTIGTLIDVKEKVDKALKEGRDTSRAIEESNSEIAKTIQELTQIKEKEETQ